MTIEQRVRQTRTVRRFEEEKTVTAELLKGLVDTARLSGSARNGQVLKYMLVTEKEQRDLVFPLLGWAGYLSDWKGPEFGERPAAYVLCLLDNELLKGSGNEAHFDCGIATQSMLLAAAEQGVYGCRIGAFAKNIDKVLNVAEPLSVMLVLALGYPAEAVVLEEVGNDGKIQYWRDEQGIHHVPKRALEDVLIETTF
jgi:nitroreductase